MGKLLQSTYIFDLGNYAILDKHWKDSFEKSVFSALVSIAENGFDEQRMIWYVFCLWDMAYSG